MPSIDVKDQATAELAARNLQTGVELPPEKTGEPKAPRRKSTAEKLFPEFTTDDGAIVNRPIKVVPAKGEPLPASATPTEAAQLQTQTTQTPTPPAYLKNEEMTGKMVKIKVDGVESDVPAESLLQNYQLKRHLDAQLMNLARERAEWERQKVVTAGQQAAPTAQNAVQPPARAPKEGKNSEVEALEARIAAMQAQMEAVQRSIQPQVQEFGIRMLDQRAKTELGADDFQAYVPKIKEFINNEIQKPGVATNPQILQTLDSSEFWFQKYSEFKLKDLIAKSANPPPTAPPPPPNVPVLRTQEGAPVVMTNSGQPVSIPVIEASGGVSSGRTPGENWTVKAQELLDRARREQTSEAWMDYYKHKTYG
jgi:hypothetical protein